MPDDEPQVPRHEFSAEQELYSFPLDMAMISCPRCPETSYPDDLGQALDWALGHQCGEAGDG